jgi:hypothetical protein
MKQHPKYPGYYVDIDGSVYSENYNRNQYSGKIKKPLKKLKPQRKGSGYHQYHIRAEGKTIQVSAHRLVAEVYLPNPNNLPQVNHIDKDKQNNAVSNLEWCDGFYNIQYSHSKHYKLRNIETGEEEIVFNLKRWCEERGYDRSAMVAASKKRGYWKKKMTKDGIKEYYCVHKTSYGYEIEECEFK